MKTSKHPMAGWIFLNQGTTLEALNCGERASVDPETVHSWKEQLSEIINMDETGLFF